MEETKASAGVSSVNDLERSSRPLLPDRMAQGWQQLEARIRDRPGPYIFSAVAIGYLSQIIPFRALLLRTGRLCLQLVRPVLFLAGAVKLIEYLRKNAKTQQI
jgi:hypothetical protein